MKCIDQNDFSLKNTCVAFGDFDGLHLGHKAVLDKMAEISGQDMTSVMVTFDYDEELLKDKKILCTQLEKQKLLQENGPDVLFSYKINSKNRDLQIDAFIQDVLVKQLGAMVIVAGREDKHIDTLRACAKEYGYTLVECETVCLDGTPVTTERICKEIEEGALATANKLLGHPYLLIGEVMHGKALGRTVGMPTANLGYKPYKQLPAHGVYGTISDIDDRGVQGLTNIGKRPSVDDFNYVTIETFLLDFSGDLYGRMIGIEIHVFIRGVCKFSCIEEVKAQVNKDIESIKNYLDEVCPNSNSRERKVM
ncbi:riboflavin biosynthesis protein RibF [Clostridia bacterium]|nr:riboflavin biosynthesis protein RibF [Clostridia bacterium]